METNTKLTPQQIQSQLSQFHGTENWYAYKTPFAAFHLTDGVKFVAEACEAYWMIDLIASYQHKRSVGGEGFQVYKFTKHDDDSMTVTITDGNDNELAKQEIDFTDFPLDNIQLWFTNDVALLPSEY